MDGLVHRPVPGLPARWFPLSSIARLSGPSITAYTPIVKVQALNSTIYEMGCNIIEANSYFYLSEKICQCSFRVSFYGCKISIGKSSIRFQHKYLSCILMRPVYVSIILRKKIVFRKSVYKIMSIVVELNHYFSLRRICVAMQQHGASKIERVA